MLEPYLDRLSALRESLDSPLSDIVQEACDLLVRLLLDYKDDRGFLEELRRIVLKNPDLVEKLKISLQKLPHGDVGEDESVLLNEAIDLIASEIPQKTSAPVKSGEAAAKHRTRAKSVKEHPQIGFSLSRGEAGTIAALISLAVLIGGLSAGYDFSVGIILSLLLGTIAIFVFFYGIISK